MPSKSYKQCANVACGELTKETYCERHAQDAHRVYRADRTDVREQDFYRSSIWRKVRNHKRTTNPLCELCLREDKLTPVDVVHHMVELKDDWSLRLNHENLMSVCFSCHNRIHKKVSGNE